MGKRFASVWAALPDGLRDAMPLQSDTEIESALFDAASTLASKKGFALVRTVNGYRLAGHGRTIHFGQIESAAAAVRKATKTTCEPLAGAGGTVTLPALKTRYRLFLWLCR